ncbi:MAG: hypothetical protein BAA01_04680 [Bacillus thermozeamaize]|uniref:Uncharacterized protein n=1 Tax=Bacillus thermozeamaize TaxID=230954 RepID=A0A1Y3PE06_9BACI|nr:MAG: hypothetical protein BAA01_04680 [Bacillus thermozeamaize]
MKKGMIILVFSLACLLTGCAKGTNDYSIEEFPFSEDKTLFIYSKKDRRPVVEDILQNRRDDSLSLLRMVMDEGLIKVVYTDESPFDVLIADVKEIRSDSHMQEYVQVQFAMGKKVFLYGGLSLEDYAELVGLDQLTLKLGDGVYDILGYSLSTSSLVAVNMSVGMLENTPSEHYYLQEILSLEKSWLERNRENLNEMMVQSDMFFPRYVEVIGSTYTSSGLLAGRLIDHYKLNNNPDPEIIDPLYDYLLLEGSTEIKGYNGYLGYRAEFKHALPFATDELLDWKIFIDTKERKIHPRVTQQVSLYEDWVSFRIANLLTRNLNGNIIQYQTKWAYPYPYTGIDIVHTALFSNGWDSWPVNHANQVRYNY